MFSGHKGEHENNLNILSELTTERLTGQNTALLQEILMTMSQYVNVS